VGDGRGHQPEFATEALDALRLHYDWLDDPPKYDEVFGWMSHYLPGYMWLARALLGRDARPLLGPRGA
jgi:hypothetical protein